jgi:hypothetical protein
VQGNLLNGTVPALPFEKMAPYNENSRACILSYSGDKARSNAFTCPLPAGALEHCIAVDAKDISAGSVPIDACNCTGASAALAGDQCLAYGNLWDATGGEHWNGAGNGCTRSDPCGTCPAGGFFRCKDALITYMCVPTSCCCHRPRPLTSRLANHHSSPHL